MTERQLLDDILESFKLPKAALKDLEDYERDLIYQAYPRYKRRYLQDLLFRARFMGYNSISKKVQAPEPIFPDIHKRYVIKRKAKTKINKAGDYINEKIKTKDKKVCL